MFYITLGVFIGRNMVLFMKSIPKSIVVFAVGIDQDQTAYYLIFGSYLSCPLKMFPIFSLGKCPWARHFRTSDL